MAEFLSAFAAELVTGPWSRVWPFLVLPLLAIWAQRGVLERIEASGAEPRRQARLAALAACVPGIITIGLTAGLAFRSLGARPEGLACVAKLYGPSLIASIAILRVGSQLCTRRFRVARLLRFAYAPSARLAAVAAEVGVPVRELPVSASVCFASGLIRPSVVVSAGALETLSDADLRAALLHERAHLRHRDTLWAAAIGTVAEFGLLSSRRALRLYRSSRESLADDEAARYVGRTTIADVLVRFARNAARVPMAASLAEPDGLERRVRRLIFPDRGKGLAELRAGLALSVAAALAFYPLFARVLEKVVFHCGK
jgi:Peptidase family M48